MRDYLSKMLYALTSAYSRKDYDNQQRGLPPETKIGKLFAVFAWGLDMIQEQAEKIKAWDNLDNAQGSVLDRYGANFGVKRDGTDDTFYRLLIKIKVMSQLSGGDTDTLVRAASQLFDIQDSQVELAELFPAKVRIYVNEDDLTPQKMREAPLISRLMKRLTAAGVGFKIFLRSYRTLPITISVFVSSFILTQSKSVPPEVHFYDKGEFRIVQGTFLQSKFFLNPPDIHFCGKGELEIAQGALSQSKSSLNPLSADFQEVNQTVNGLGSFYQSRITLRPVQEE